MTTVLLLAVVVPDILPPEARSGHRCACGMTVGCCCLLKAAMKAGDHCMLKQRDSGCKMRPFREPAAEIRTEKDRADRVAFGLLESLKDPLAPVGLLARIDSWRPESPRPDPPTPPPRSFQTV